MVTVPLTEGETKPVVLSEKWAQRDDLVLLGKLRPFASCPRLTVGARSADAPGSFCIRLVGGVGEARYG
jgi:hypothetical protein